MTSRASVQEIDAEERKRLGQFFTGGPLARLLATLAEAETAQTIIDPMAGSGDMLVAARQVGSHNSALTAIEIDPIVAEECVQRLGVTSRHSSTVITGNAFSSDLWSKLPGGGWDVVITNPPYVRYQRTAHRATGRVSVPSANEIRVGLRGILEQSEPTNGSEREVFVQLALGYSGLADLAVPAWILCAYLVAEGGRLAMVVPDTWLSRDYALPVLYLLRRYFEVEFVVEDGAASWFEDAQVRTTLLIAKRVPDRGTALHSADTGHLHVRLDPRASTASSVVGALDHQGLVPEYAFANMLRELRGSRSSHVEPGLMVTWTSDDHFRDLIEGRTHRVPWLEELEPASSHPGSRVSLASSTHVPRQIHELLDRPVLDHLQTLDDYGWLVGQGLRTGANRFFYGESIQSMETQSLLVVDPAISREPILIPNDAIRVVVRKQKDASTAGHDMTQSPGRLIDLGNYVLPEDGAAIERTLGSCPYRTMPEALAQYVRNTAMLDVGTFDDPRCIPDLTAVVTNIRPMDASRPDRPPRFWYQLPPIAPRHVPELFIPRINHGHAQAMMNSEGVVIDANFATMWRDDARRISPHALLALLHSAWALLILEASGTVLGGGALKLEATQLRRLPLPKLEKRDIHGLDALGHRLTLDRSSPATFARINKIVWAALAPAATDNLTQSLDRLRSHLLQHRNPSAREPIFNLRRVPHAGLSGS